MDRNIGELIWDFTTGGIRVIIMSFVVAIFYSIFNKFKERRPPSTAKQQWIIEEIKYLRKLGFFLSFKTKTDQEICSILNKQYREEWGRNLEPAEELFDLTILSFDQERVWWEDTEADVCAENGVYVEVLQAWKRISRGSFNPVDIRENWKDEAGPVSVSFKLKGKEVVLHPKYLDDFIDIEVLKEINKLIANTGYSFEVYELFDQTIFVVVLTQDEKQKLIKERHWRFW